MKKLLLPTDFSEHSFQALVYVLKLFEGEDFELHLFHAYTMPASVGVLISVNEILEEEAMERLRSEERRVKEHLGYPPVRFELLAFAGSFHELLPEVIQAKEIDLVVMGTKGAHGLVDTLLGTHTARVIAETKCPLLTIPSNAYFNDIKSVVFATDYDTDLKSLNGQWSLVQWVQDHHKPMFTQLHISDPEEATLHAKEAGNRQQTITKQPKALPAVVSCRQTKETAYHKDVVDGIASYIVDNKADIVVLVAHKHGWVGRVFHQSVSQRLAMRNLSPLLILHD